MAVAVAEQGVEMGLRHGARRLAVQIIQATPTTHTAAMEIRCASSESPSAPLRIITVAKTLSTKARTILTTTDLDKITSSGVFLCSGAVRARWPRPLLHHRWTTADVQPCARAAIRVGGTSLPCRAG